MKSTISDSPQIQTDLPGITEPVSPPAVNSLRELIDYVTGRNLISDGPQDESGIAEALPFPFFGLVGQYEMKLALLLAVINPMIGGVLLIGPRGTGKTTAARSLLDLLPEIERSACFYGCLPEDVEAGGMDAVCPDCARKFAEGKSLLKTDKVRLVELPLNARLEDVIGGLDERAAVHDRLRLRRGILAHADLNLLYVDEVNLLPNEIVDSILDASGQGIYTVRRGPISATYRSRFTLIGTMNPEEGNLRPQIMDRFGLRIIVRGLESTRERLEAYHQVKRFRTNARRIVNDFAGITQIARQEILKARNLLPQVILPDKVAKIGIDLIRQMKVDSLRAEITLFESARAYAAADDRKEVELSDLRAIAAPALRLRRSTFMTQYFAEQQTEDNSLTEVLGKVIPETKNGESQDGKND